MVMGLVEVLPSALYPSPTLESKKNLYNRAAPETGTSTNPEGEPVVTSRLGEEQVEHFEHRHGDLARLVASRVSAHYPRSMALF